MPLGGATAEVEAAQISKASKAPQASGPVLSPGIYITRSAGSAMAAAAGSRMMLCPYRPTAAWAFKHAGNNLCAVRMSAALLGGAGSGARTITKSRADGTRLWRLERVGRLFRFVNAETGQAMTLTGGERVAKAGRNSGAL